MLGKILSAPTEQVGRAGRFAITQLKLWSHCARLLKKNRSGQQAAALSYHTIFGIVPLAIVMLLIFQLFPVYQELGEKVKGLVYEQLHLSKIEYPNPEATAEQENILLTEYLDRIVGGYFTGLNRGSITIISTVLVIWAALALLSTIEKAFNNIWHVSRGRSFFQRVINYWALLTLGPLLLGLGIYVTTRYSGLGQLQKTVLSHIGPTVLSYIIATVCFFLLYFVLPNTRVQAKAAIWGAAVAALVWSLAKWGFGACIIKFVPYGKVYGVLGIIPLSVFWIYLSWLIVLFGLQLTFTTQHLKSLDAAEIAAARRTEEYFIADDFTVINIVREIAAAFEADKAPVSSAVICSKLDIPAEFGDKIFDHLVNSGIILKSSEPRTGFVPAKDPANIKLSEISEAVAAAGFGRPTTESAGALEQITQTQRDALAQYNIKQILG
jgi:membrane protein